MDRDQRSHCVFHPTIDNGTKWHKSRCVFWWLMVDGFIPVQLHHVISKVSDMIWLTDSWVVSYHIFIIGPGGEKMREILTAVLTP